MVIELNEQENKLILARMQAKETLERAFQNSVTALDNAESIQEVVTIFRKTRQNIEVFCLGNNLLFVLLYKIYGIQCKTDIDVDTLTVKDNFQYENGKLIFSD